MNSKELLRLIKAKNLISGYIHLDTQLTPNGFDLTAGSIFSFSSSGALDFSNKERVLPREKELIAKKNRGSDTAGWWSLKKGAYKVRTNETVCLPPDCIAIAFPRSSLLRMGVFCHNGVWDAGFCGRSEFLLVVENPAGLKLKQNARVVQLVFMRLSGAHKTYKGIYQNL
ncbi:MAG: deoxyuridine 5'-triphosphate nucleotidohydrolase [Candidatus Omnitrophica bacterium]|nr:deoxyuridine 5'-triphosphate nucleotidohydrolase [Candidatus Omnitrophota bacterium]